MQESDNAVSITDPLERLLNLVIGHEHAIESVLNIVEAADQKGILTMAQYLVEDLSDLMEAGVQLLAQPSTIQIKDKGTQWLGVIKQLDPTLFEQGLKILTRVAEEIQAPESSIQVKGLWDIVKAMRDPDIRNAISKLFGALKVVGGLQRIDSN